MPKFIPAGCKFWPEQATALKPSDVIKRYEDGFAGVWFDPDARERFRQLILDTGGVVNGADAAHASGFAESGAGKLVAPFVYADLTFKGCWPGPGQERGSCVAHDTKNACLLSLICEIIAAKPDEITGVIEGIPDVPALGVNQGALSTEWLYWWRGYNGDGWNCDEAAAVAIKHGIMLRTKYDDLGIDLTKYSGGLEGKYGRTAPPDAMDAEGRKHLVRTATELTTFEALRDFLHNGYGVSSCGSEGFSSTRDENGVSKRQGRWSHAMAYIGADDRDEVKQIYGGPLVLVLNSWGVWNGGPRRIRGTSIDIPEGSFWARWSDLKARYHVALSSVNGWQRKNLPDFMLI